MRMNSRSPWPFRRKRGPRLPAAGFTATTTFWAPLAVPASSRARMCARRTMFSRSIGIRRGLLRRPGRARACPRSS